MYFKINENQELHYRIYGNGQPLLIIHGLYVDMNMMIPSFERALKNAPIQRIYIDLPGMGKSSAFANPSTNQILEYLLKFVQEFVKDQKLWLAGHSLGGYLALALAYKLQNQVEKVFDACGPIYLNHKKRYLAEHKTIFDDNNPVVDPNPQIYNNYCNVDVKINSDTYQAYLNDVQVGIEKSNRDFIHELQRENDKYYSLDFEPSLRNDEIDVDLFMVLGKYDNVVGYKDQVELLTNWTNSALVILKDSGHVVSIDQPEIYEELIKKYFVS